MVEELSGETDVVLGIKEAPVSDIKKLRAKDGRPRTWMMFSHTHKGQVSVLLTAIMTAMSALLIRIKVYNTPLLSALLDDQGGQTLIDHELLTVPDKNGGLKRVAAFGWYAGAVGAGEALCLTGLALLKRGIATPLLVCPAISADKAFVNLSASRTTVYIHFIGRVQRRIRESG